MKEVSEFSHEFVEKQLSDLYYEFEETTWHVIAKNRHTEIIKNEYFHLDPREINQKNKLGLTPLNMAVDNNDLEMVIELVKHGAKVLEGGGAKVLTQAVENNNPEMFNELIKCGAKISDSDKLKFLTHAVENNNPKMVEFLISNLKINNINNLEKEKRKRDLTLLHKACLLGSLNICQQLINAGADLNATCIWQNIHQDTEDNIYLENATPLHLAIIGKNELIVKELIEKKATLITKCSAVKRGNFYLGEKFNPLLICESGSEIFFIINEAIEEQKKDLLTRGENPAPDLELSCKRLRVGNLVDNGANAKMV